MSFLFDHIIKNRRMMKIIKIVYSENSITENPEWLNDFIPAKHNAFFHILVNDTAIPIQHCDDVMTLEALGGTTKGLEL